jgi:hypothetical protein
MFVPHILTEIPREDHLVRSIGLLLILVRAEQTKWYFILMDDEFWFFSCPANSRI